MRLPRKRYEIHWTAREGIWVTHHRPRGDMTFFASLRRTMSQLADEILSRYRIRYDLLWYCELNCILFNAIQFWPCSFETYKWCNEVHLTNSSKKCYSRHGSSKSKMASPYSNKRFCTFSKNFPTALHVCP